MSVQLNVPVVELMKYLGGTADERMDWPCVREYAKGANCGKAKTKLGNGGQLCIKHLPFNLISMQVLDRGDLEEGDLDAAWVIKARVQLQSADHEAALETATQGLKILIKRPDTHDSILSELRLIVGLCLVEAGQLDRATAALEMRAGSHNFFLAVVILDSKPSCFLHNVSMQTVHLQCCSCHAVHPASRDVTIQHFPGGFCGRMLPTLPCYRECAHIASWEVKSPSEAGNARPGPSRPQKGGRRSCRAASPAAARPCREPAAAAEVTAAK